MRGWIALLWLCAACQAEPAVRRFTDQDLPAPDAGPGPAGFVCADEQDQGCLLGKHYTCSRNFEFIVAEPEDCTLQGKVCDDTLGCVNCQPGALTCDGLDVARCGDDGEDFTLLEQCDVEAGRACVSGECVHLCETAQQRRSYEGCIFYAADLDNATIGGGFDAAANQYAVVVSNPQLAPVDVIVEVNEAPLGQPPQVREVARALIFPDDLEVFELERRELDGSTPGGLNDGTHSALTSNAYRVRSSLPIIAYQFNPLDNVGVFSNDASLLLPVTSLSGRYTVAAWPQTIANDTDPRRDFNPRRDDEDLRAFLTIIGSEPDTRVRVDWGDNIVKVVGAPGIPEGVPGGSLEVTLGEFDVLNLETEGFLADLTGSVVDADKPVVVFVGSEASDVPAVSDVGMRRCCADHLEEQLLPDATLGQRFVVARMPDRVRWLNQALVGGYQIGTPGGNEAAPEYVRVVAVEEGTTVIETSLDPPDARIELTAREAVTLRADRDFRLSASQPVAVIQAVGSQETTGITSPLPGGDPALLVVPPQEQLRRDYTFLTPDKYVFDFVSVIAGRDTTVLLDGQPLPDSCVTQCVQEPDADGQLSCGEAVVHRCPLSAPVVVTEPEIDASGGEQNDGVHSVQADAPVAVLVYGFDAFVSYAYAAGLNLEFAL